MTATIADTSTVRVPNDDINIKLNINPSIDSMGEAINCLASFYYSSYIQFIGIQFEDYDNATYNNSLTRLKIVIHFKFISNFNSN
jgi:hypothetical protein